jgi:hypothetical protein
MYLLKPGRLSKYLEYFVINYITYILFVDSKSSLCYLRTRDVRLLENLRWEQTPVLSASFASNFQLLEILFTGISF